MILSVRGMLMSSVVDVVVVFVRLFVALCMFTRVWVFYFISVTSYSTRVMVVNMVVGLYSC